MAGGKETPRQKMIGMMYLVLTALLALNVSKSILDAFVTIDEQALTQNDNVVKSINGIGTKIGYLMKDPQSKKTAEKIMPIYETVRGIANEADDLFFNNLNELFEKTEGKKWFTKDAKTQVTKTLFPLEEIEKKDDYDTPTRLFGGDTPESRKRGEGLRNKLMEYRDKLILTIADSIKDDKNKIHTIIKSDLESEEKFAKFLERDQHPNKGVLLEIYSSLTKPEKIEQHEKDKKWNVARFYHQPLIGVVSTMTSLRNDIRLAQEKASKMLLSRIDKPMMNINKVEAQVLASTQYMNVGEKLNVKVGIVAFDSTKQYPVKYKMSAEADYTESDSGSFVVNASSAGEKEVFGSLKVELAGEPTELPFNFKYTVGKPSASISAPELNVLYRGYDNKIKAVASGYPPSSVKVTCSGCSSFSRSGELWIAKVSGAKDATISVTADGKKVGFQEFRVKALPKPQPYFAGKTYGDKSIKSGSLKQAKLLKARLADSPLNIAFSVRSFTLDVIVNGKLVTEKTKGGSLTPKMKNLIKNAKRGSKIFISDVQVAGPDGKSKPIGGLTLRVS